MNTPSPPKASSESQPVSDFVSTSNPKPNAWRSETMLSVAEFESLRQEDLRDSLRLKALIASRLGEPKG